MRAYLQSREDERELIDELNKIKNGQTQKQLIKLDLSEKGAGHY